MTGPQPYDVVALARIRTGASASDLGWRDEFYRTVCRTHGLPLNALPARPPAPVELPIVAASGEYVWQKSTGTLTRGKRALALSARQTEAFDTLHRHLESSGDGFLPARTLGRTPMQDTVIALKKKLVPFGIYIDTHKGPHGGHRLRIEP